MSIINQENGKEEKKCLLDNWDDISLMWNFARCGMQIFFWMEFVNQFDFDN